MASIGEQLRQAREAKGATISQAASATRIKFQHIESIENDDFSNIAAAAYARGFIKIYAEYLGLNPTPLLDAYNTEHARPEPRPSLSDEPRRPAEPDEEAHGEGEGETWADQVMASGLLQRVVLPAGVIVVLIVLVVGVVRWLSGGNGGDDATALPDGAPLLIQEPPDPYLAVPRNRESRP